MNSDLLFEFSVNREKKTIHIKREFNADLELVWKAWTTAELLDQWTAPKPWKAETRTMDFREGGFWLYAMVSPEGQKMWIKADYISIVHEKSIKGKGGFCDENGTLNPAFPQNLREISFIPKGSKVEVDILITLETLADVEKYIEMGFKEGTSASSQQLDELLLTLTKRHV